MLGNLILLLTVFIRVMQPFLWGVTWYAVTIIASLAVGYIHLSCCHLFILHLTTVPTQSKLNTQRLGVISFS